MYSKPALTLALLPLVQLSFGQSLLQVSKVFYFDQLPADFISGIPPELDGAKDQLYIRKDVEELDGPSLSCDATGTIELGFENVSALELDGVGYEMIGHPIIVPHNYTSAEGCPDLKNHTLYGPRKAVPEEFLADLSDEEDYAVFIAMSIDALEDGKLTVSAIWTDYHSLLGAIGDAPEGLEWFNVGIYPWTDLSGSSDKVKRINGQNRAAAVNAGVGFVLERFWGALTGKN